MNTVLELGEEAEVEDFAEVLKVLIAAYQAADKELGDKIDGLEGELSHIKRQSSN